MSDTITIAISTCPDEASARRIAETLVSERLAACVNRLGSVRSTYFWDGGLQDDAEIMLIMKTTSAGLPQLQARLEALHPYEVPELLVLPVAGGNEAYLEWVRRGVREVGEPHDPAGAGAGSHAGEGSGGHAGAGSAPHTGSRSGLDQHSSEDPHRDPDEDR